MARCRKIFDRNKNQEGGKTDKDKQKFFFLSNFWPVGPENTRKNDDGLNKDQQYALALKEKKIRNKIDKKEAERVYKILCKRRSASQTCQTAENDDKKKEKDTQMDQQKGGIKRKTE